eukprot:3651190-Prymnesium_polylepis.1
MAPPSACPLATKLFKDFDCQEGLFERVGQHRLSGIHIVGTNKEGARVQVAEPTSHITNFREIKEQAHLLLDKSPEE